MASSNLPLIGLCSEFCTAVQQAHESEPQSFVNSMIRLLPRIYITMLDIEGVSQSPFATLEPALDEDSYTQAQSAMASLLGEEDTYLEAIHEEMRYSETPIAMSIAENLADLYQVFYNFLSTVADAPDYLIDEAIAVLKDDFIHFWGQTLCNVMRPLNHIAFINEN